MPTIFIAVQCSQCSTMQVKQKKKSSNKWTCVVCNQKQSVRKVFAQGFMAKDVRKFVQSFNMSRKFADERRSPDETLFEEDTVADCDPFLIDQKKRRSDWSEYLDPEGVNDKEEENENVCEPKIVTELPREMFKKPKLKNYSAGSSSGECDGLFKPLLSKRNSNKHVISQEKEAREFQPTVAKGTSSKWSDYITREDTEPRKCQPTEVKGDSKWNDYLCQDDNDLQIGTYHMSQLNNNDVLETITNDQRVEDDIHPDFM